MSNNYNIIRIQQYLSGALSREEMYQLEREALDDPLLNDAIEGYRQQQNIDHGRLSLLQQRLTARIEGQRQERNRFYFSWQRLGVAATACVLMVLVLTLLWMRNHPDQPAAEKEVAVELATPEMMITIHAEPVTGEGFNAYPLDGWERFNAYLAENKRNFSADQQLMLTFDIDPAGRPEAIQAADEVSASLMAEIQRLLREGPVWQGTKGKIAIVVE